MKLSLKQLIKQDLAGNKPKWCSHMVFWSRSGGINYTFGGDEYSEAGGWKLKNFNTLDLDCNKWKFCPICGIKKPY